MFLNSFPFTTVYIKNIVVFYVLHRGKKKVGKNSLFDSKYLCLCLKNVFKYLAIICLSV